MKHGIESGELMKLCGDHTPPPALLTPHPPCLNSWGCRNFHPICVSSTSGRAQAGPSGPTLWGSRSLPELVTCSNSRS
jgi:hypothetical protein